jgi:hypothetical protein
MATRTEGSYSTLETLQCIGAINRSRVIVYQRSKTFLPNTHCSETRSTSFANKPDQPSNALLEAAIAIGVDYSASLDRDRSAARVALIIG